MTGRPSDAPCAVVILAAGKGTRMKSALPKVLHPLAGRPMLSWVLETVGALDPSQIIGVVGPDMAAVAAQFGESQTVIQDPQCGTGDAVRCALPALTMNEGDVIVAYGDSPLVSAESMARLRAARAGDDNPAVVVLGFRPTDPTGYGRLVVDESGRLSGIVEHGDADAATRAITLCNSGVMAIDGEMVSALVSGLTNDNPKGEYYLTDIVAAAVAAGRSCAVVEGAAEEFQGINDRADLAAVEQVVQARLRNAAMREGATLQDPATTWMSWDTQLAADVVVEPQVYFGAGVQVESGVHIRGFCHLEHVHIGRNAVIGPFARIRGGTDIGPDVRIGNFVELKATTMAPGAKASHLSYLGDAAIGAKANIGAGTITCNYDGFAKNRTEIGEGAFIGSNAALVAPIKIGDGAIVGAGSVVTRNVADDAMAVTRAPQKNLADGAARFRSRRGGSVKPKS